MKHKSGNFCKSLNLLLHMIYEIGLLKKFGKFTGKHLCRKLFFNKVAGWKSCWWLKCIAGVFWRIFQYFLQNFSIEHVLVTASPFGNLVSEQIWIPKVAKNSLTFSPLLFVKWLLIRSSRSQMFFKIGVPKNFGIFTGKHLRLLLLIHRKMSMLVL